MRVPFCIDCMYDGVFLYVKTKHRVESIERVSDHNNTLSTREGGIQIVEPDVR